MGKIKAVRTHGFLAKFHAYSGQIFILGEEHRIGMLGERSSAPPLARAAASWSWHRRRSRFRRLGIFDGSQNALANVPCRIDRIGTPLLRFGIGQDLAVMPSLRTDSPEADLGRQALAKGLVDRGA